MYEYINHNKFTVLDAVKKVTVKKEKKYPRVSCNFLNWSGQMQFS